MTSPTDVAAFDREYVGADRRAARCFAQREQVIDPITEKRAASGTDVDAEPTVLPPPRRSNRTARRTGPDRPEYIRDENRGRAVDAIEPWSVLAVMERVDRPLRDSTGQADGTTPASRTAIDVDAFVREVTPRLVGALTIRVGDRGVAEDLAHEALARAVANWDRVAAMASPDGWVFRVAFNLAASRWRRLRVQRRVEAAMDRAEPSIFLLTAESLAVRESLGRLSDRQIQVIVLRYYAGFDVAEVASILRVSTSTVTTLTARAMRKMRADLEDDE